MTDTEEAIARGTTEQRQADEWALVLTAAGIPHALRSQLGEWVLHVAADDVARARAALDAYDSENPARPAHTAPTADDGWSIAGIILALALLAFYGVTAWHREDVPWMRAGSATAARIAAGELWRAVTALTLHSTPAHVFGNAVCCAIFATALCRALGVGVGMWLMLIAGTGGNIATALLRGAPHSAVGASTAIFGAVGALGALQVVTRARRGVPRRRVWVPLAAAVGLLAMLGTSPDSDVLAHFFGFILGAVLGGVAAIVWSPPLGRGAQFALAFGGLAVVVAAWAAALR